MRLPAVLAVLLVAVPICVAQAAEVAAPHAAVALAAHRAEYSLTLDSARDSDVIAARGTMGYEVLNACDGWAVRQRLDMTVTNSDGQDVHMISDYATWEAMDGLKLRFHMTQQTDSAITAQTDGEAVLEHAGGPGVAHYTVPKTATVPLPVGTLFPMAHTAAIIAAARGGKKFLALPLFDGTDDSGAEDTSIAIIDWKPPFKTEWPFLTELPSTRVRLAFFERKPDTMMPDYQVGMRYWENGVADDMQMDFGDFVMDAKLTKLVPQPHKC
ncbi:MAG TPA: DUF1849 family protein [Acetobacteraceae bacterium]|jgi:hypothetical protein